MLINHFYRFGKDELFLSEIDFSFSKKLWRETAARLRPYFS